jgi:polysaccharide deacetylase family protein (PEP-CTERM system associated)
LKLSLSVDVEDWFQVENLKGAISRASWSEREFRAEANTDWILATLAETDTKGTFFMLGWVAERVPGLVKRIHAEGHEIASHGYGHDLIYTLSPRDFQRDVERSKGFLEELTGERVLGYRAPSFSITDWAIDILITLGFRYDSSLFRAAAHDRYGSLETFTIAEEPCFELRKDFYQVPLSYLTVAGKKVPWAGGGYFRVFPYPLFKWGVTRIVQTHGAYTFYIHPWEFDSGQPRVDNLSWQHRFRHYRNLSRTKTRFADMVRSFHFKPIRALLP